MKFFPIIVFGKKKIYNFILNQKGKEEIVALDMICAKGGYPFSAVGDIDENVLIFHHNINQIWEQLE